MTIDGSYYTEDQRHALIQAWLTRARDTGRLVDDPLSSATVRDVHLLYQEMNPDHQMSRNAFGAIANAYIPASVRGPGGRWIRPGLRITS